MESDRTEIGLGGKVLPPGAEPLKPGDPPVIDGHRLTGRLASGGTSVVYLAHGPEGRPVALKTTRARQGDQTQARRWLRTEAACARRLPPFCTAPLLVDGSRHTPPYLISEYVEGPSLAQYVRFLGLLDAKQLRALASALARAIAAVHGAGLIHCDLKPGNVLLSSDGPRIIDFSIAQETAISGRSTEPGTVPYSPGWVAPERLSGLPATPAVDIFGWGCLVGFAATGHSPFEDEDADHWNVARSTDLAVLEEPLRALVEAALAVDPSDRPSTGEITARLGGLAAPEAAEAARRSREPGLLPQRHEPTALPQRDEQEALPVGREPEAPPWRDEREAMSQHDEQRALPEGSEPEAPPRRREPEALPQGGEPMRLAQDGEPKVPPQSGEPKGLPQGGGAEGLPQGGGAEGPPRRRGREVPTAGSPGAGAAVEPPLRQGLVPARSPVDAPTAPMTRVAASTPQPPSAPPPKPAPEPALEPSLGTGGHKPVPPPAQGAGNEPPLATAPEPGHKPTRDTAQQPGHKPPHETAHQPGSKPPREATHDPGFEPPREAAQQPGYEPPRETPQKPGHNPPHLAAHQPGSKPPREAAQEPGYEPAREVAYERAYDAPAPLRPAAPPEDVPPHVDDAPEWAAGRSAAYGGGYQTGETAYVPGFGDDPAGEEFADAPVDVFDPRGERPRRRPRRLRAIAMVTAPAAAVAVLATFIAMAASGTNTVTPAGPAGAPSAGQEQSPGQAPVDSPTDTQPHQRSNGPHPASASSTRDDSSPPIPTGGRSGGHTKPGSLNHSHRPGSPPSSAPSPTPTHSPTPSPTPSPTDTTPAG